MEEISVNDFGGEVKFTKYIADNETISARLLEAIGSAMLDFKVVPEEHTVGSKRVDLIVRDENDNVVQVIESQDANGWLDPVHASKIAWYCHDKGCNDGVLISEDCTEHMKTFIQWYNENTPLNIFLLSPTIIKDKDGEIDIFFKTILRPTDWAHKRIKPNTKQSGNGQLNQRDIERAANVEALYEDNKDVFTNRSSYYVSSNDVNGTGINVTLYFRANDYNICLWHSGKHTHNQTFMDSVENAYPNVAFKKMYVCLGAKETLEEAVDFVRTIKTQLNDGTIVVEGGDDEEVKKEQISIDDKLIS